MKFTSTSIRDLYTVALQSVADERGWFARAYCKKEFAEIGHSREWVQLNHSYTSRKGTIRGMHFQHPPFREIKLIRCIRGAVWDVAVDLRKDSNTFLKWFAIELSAENMQMIYIPEGFAHGFQALVDDCELLYHHSEYYTPGFEGGIRYDDPGIEIVWPLPLANISERDLSHQLLGGNFKGI